MSPILKDQVGIARGDLIYIDSTGAEVRLPLGAINKFLRSNGTDLLYDYKERTTVVAGSSATCTPTGDTAEIYSFQTSNAGTLTIAAPSGTPYEGQALTLRIKTTAGAQSYSFNAIYRFSTTVAAPVTSSNNKWDYVGLRYNAVDSKWDVVAIDQGH